MEWIKCSDRMPEDGRDVLAWHIEGYPRLVRWEENRNPLFTSPCGNYSRLADGWADISELDVHEPEGSFTHWAGSLYDINNNALTQVVTMKCLLLLREEKLFLLGGIQSREAFWIIMIYAYVGICIQPTGCRYPHQLLSDTAKPLSVTA